MLVRLLALVAALHLSVAPAFARGGEPAPAQQTAAPPPADALSTDQEAEPPTPGTSDDWLDLLFKKLFALTNVTNSLNWVYYAGAGTVFYYKWFYKPALDVARLARTNLLQEYEKTHGKLETKQEALAKLDKLIAKLETRVAEAEEAIPKLDAKIREASGLDDGHGGRTIFKGLPDYANLSQWLGSDAGRRFLESKEGQRWNAGYQDLLDKTTTDVERPLTAIIKRANALYPPENFRDIISTHNQGGKPGTFAAVEYLKPRSDQIALKDIPHYVKSRVRARCADYLGKLGKKDKSLLARSSAWDYWVRQGNLKAPFLHGLVVTASLGGTFWLYRATRYDAARQESARRARQKLKAEDDIFGEFSDPPKHAPIQPFEDIVVEVLKEHEAALVKSLERNLTVDERSQVDIKQVVAKSFERRSLNAALHRAIPFAAKRTQGEFTNLAALQAMIHASKTDREKQESIFKPFLKTMYRELFNSLWSDLSLGDPSDNISVGVLRSMMDSTTAKLEKDTRLQAPPQQKTPKAPGVPLAGK